MSNDRSHDQIFSTSQDKVEDIMKKVFEKYKTDKTFEQNLIKNPTGTLKKEGLELKPGFSFQIVKTIEEANSLPVNIIPLLFENKKVSLSLDELDQVAGGKKVMDDELGYREVSDEQYAQMTPDQKAIFFNMKR
jgi:hypothetical protein